MSEHTDLVARAQQTFPDAQVADHYDYAEFRRRCLALLKETVPASWPAGERQTCALRGLALLAARNQGNLREFAGRLFDEIGALPA